MKSSKKPFWQRVIDPQVISIVKFIHSLDHGLIPCVLARNILEALRPFINIVCSALILDRLILKTPAEQMMQIVFWMVGLNFVCSMLVALLDWVEKGPKELFLLDAEAFAKKALQLDYQEMEQKIRPIAKALHINQLLEKFPYEVSGGQKQRAAVARALITDPKLILADEPTGALDSRAASDLLSMFNEVNREGQTILMVTHSAQAASHASRVLFIKDGEVFHQIYRGTKTRQEMYQMIADTLTILTTGGETYA